MKSLCVAVLGLAAAFALTASAKADDNAKLIGKWEVTKSGGETPVGTIVDFQKDGKMAAVATLDGKEVKFAGAYKFDGKKLKLDLTIGEEKKTYEFDVKFKGADELDLVMGETTDTLKKKK